MLGGHHVQQIREFLQQVHHAHVAVFRQHHAFTSSGDRAFSVEDFDHHLNARAALVGATLFVWVNQGVEKRFIPRFGGFFENG